MNTIHKLKKIAFWVMMLILPHFASSQTCPNGSATALTGYGITASGGASGSANATGAILSAGTTLNSGNSATSSTTIPLVIDLQKWVAQGSTLTIAWARNSGTPTGNIHISNDNTSYVSLGTISGSVSVSSVYATFTVPSGGLRYVRITGTAGVFFIDGVRYTHTCYYRADAISDVRVVLNPGKARGDISYNDLNYDNDNKSFSLYQNVSNGTLTFNSSGAYTYIPTAGFEGVDVFTYILTDAGPDGNLVSTLDNWHDTTTVTFRTLFNCDSSTYYIPVPENESMDFLKDISPTSGPNSDPSIVYLSISVASEAMVIFDHWEDGFETDIKSSIQSTTKIWGDGDLTNGIAPGFPSDLLSSGHAIILSNSLSSGHSGSTSYNPNSAGSDALLQSVVDYDGKDKVYIGGSGGITKLVWGSLGTVSICGSSVPPTTEWGTSYIMPVGINTPNSGTSFQITSLSILAKASGSVVTIDRDANGTTDITVTLNQGETYYLDSRFAGAAVAVNQGATINSTKPVMVTIMTGQYNAIPYQSRTYKLTPTAFLSNCYYMPAVPQETMRVFLYNPSGSAITVTRTTAGGVTSTINVAANSSNYNDVNSSGLGYKYCSSNNFSILTTVDYSAGNSDWGFIPNPDALLTSSVLVGYGDGQDPTSGTLGTNNYTQALVTADCNTYLYVDTDGDGLPNNVSFNADVDATDAVVTIGSINYNETTSNNGIYLQAYQTLTIGSTSGSLNGCLFWTKTVANNLGNEGCDISIVWGQNGGPISAPNIDAGYSVPNIRPDLPNLIVTSSDSVMVEYRFGDDSMTVSYTGGTAPYKAFWFNENTLNYSVFNTNDTSFIIHDLEPGNYIIKLRDANCRSFSREYTIYEIPSAHVYGRIYHDANGLTNSIIDGTIISSVQTSQLYMYLVKSSGIIFDTARLNINGDYEMTGIQSTNYTARLSTISAGLGSVAPAQNLPSSWVNVAEQYGLNNSLGSGFEAGTANGIISTGIGSSAISFLNFSLEIPAISHNKTFNITIDSVLQNYSGNSNFPYKILLYNTSGTADTTVSGSGTMMPGKLSGFDAEDGRMKGSTGLNGKLAFTQLPDSATNGVLVYNGILLFNNPVPATAAYAFWSVANSRYEIPAFDPDLLKLYVKVGYQINTSFEYAYIDNANMLGTISDYIINYQSPLPMHIVYTGEMNGTFSELNWRCFNKENISSFELERGFENDLNAAFLARIEDSESDPFIFRDDLSMLPSGVYYYYLYSVNKSGQRTPHGVVELHHHSSGKPQAVVFPNPATDEVLLNLYGFNSKSVKNASLYSDDGKLVDVFEFQGNTTYMNLENFAEGIYFLNISDSKVVSTITFTIHK